MAADLLPCPFCQSEHVVVMDTDGAGGFEVECFACRWRGPWCAERNAAMAAWNRRAPPLAAPAPSAMATGEDELTRVREAWIAARQVVFAARAVLEAFGERDEPHIDDHQSAALRELRETTTAYDQRNHERTTPPAAPAAVTVTEAQVCEAWKAMSDVARREGGVTVNALRAALAAAASAGMGE